MNNILITGLPGVGKTTLITQILKELKVRAIGFVTKELRKEGSRYGFTVETLSGTSMLLASKKEKYCKYRVGKYCVYVENVDSIVKILEEEIRKKSYSMIVIDEIGKMELFSPNFKKFLLNSLEEQKVFGTIMMRDNSFTKEIKTRPDVKLYNIDRTNRDWVKQIISRKIMDNQRL
ncbi:MAG: AAA family ATPase [Candidatus Heimdallarchaeota archaeon]|nr:AAA family ATPase [Candidatus Heimdallarchaeota archaeon]MCK4878783.1 AAA family ATPase [Candidatus Heimdallarchaeota archaeon]